MRAPQYSCEPVEGDWGAWHNIFYHCGHSLTPYVIDNEWCRLNEINSGLDYLFLWVAWLLQKPQSSLPYLFFYGPQNSGKSTFHESIRRLIKDGLGYVHADKALANSSGFNGELEGAILCVIEETDLGKTDSPAYNRIKDWVTSPHISIRKMRTDAFDSPNLTHWIQCANDIRACPIIHGDTRITAIYVESLHHIVEPIELGQQLQKETPAMLHALLTTKLPPREGRLNIPVIDTGEKLDEGERKLNDVEIFIRDYCHSVLGEVVLFADFYQRLNSFTDLGRTEAGRLLPPQYPKGRFGAGGQIHIGNLSFHDVEQTRPRVIRIGHKLTHERPKK